MRTGRTRQTRRKRRTRAKDEEVEMDKEDEVDKEARKQAIESPTIAKKPVLRFRVTIPGPSP